MQRVLAAFIFFTRLPFWRLGNVSAEYFKNVVSYWSLTGWLTAGLSVLTLYISALFLPGTVAILLAIITRLLVTGCLHEDGLADFFDGFGGGNTRDRILTIMKDSHIGTYGVVGLICYFGLYFAILVALPLELTGAVMLVADPYSKSVSSMIINRLPYVRTSETSKNKTVYNRMNKKEYFISFLFGLLPLLWLPHPVYLFACILPVLIWFILTSFMNRKLQGYSGDCCGATFLLCELSFYLGILIIYVNQ
ncbi:adenosylcobinamide-GDP ribazoletransferase [Parabacteroides sp. PF5-9]|uniref:adenosylcobinamide-GDP ribazoletransferase n=1 Tax=Parabacteroides sp. PF5-9 TaxID=1742404 RepID=UPI0024765A83|nr:adenosylcobinamide-GDP ribazoletransferase [Parabacteroides sp. PF5-9]MDH6357375.1 adenosylcobinamide-GDP ribazoletransferase [Parabacteroides sp. PF5-9]